MSRVARLRGSSTTQKSGRARRPRRRTRGVLELRGQRRATCCPGRRQHVKGPERPSSGLIDAWPHAADGPMAPRGTPSAVAEAGGRELARARRDGARCAFTSYDRERPPGRAPRGRSSRDGRRPARPRPRGSIRSHGARHRRQPRSAPTSHGSRTWDRRNARCVIRSRSSGLLGSPEEPRSGRRLLGNAAMGTTADARGVAEVVDWLNALAPPAFLNAHSMLQPRRRDRRLDPLRRENRAAQELNDEPVFVLGHPRTGTTHLHNLLSKDPRFAYANTFQVGFPSSFLEHGKYGGWLARTWA